MSKSLARKLDRGVEPLRQTASYVAPFWDLAARLYVANVFFKSGLLRLADWQNGTFSNQIYLVTSEHPVPHIPPVFAAYASMIGEIILPILLAIGLFGRFAAAGLLIMTLVIIFTYVHGDGEILWLFLGASIFIKGPGILSVDYLLLKWLRRH